MDGSGLSPCKQCEADTYPVNATYCEACEAGTSTGSGAAGGLTKDDCRGRHLKWYSSSINFQAFFELDGHSEKSVFR